MKTLIFLFGLIWLLTSCEKPEIEDPIIQDPAVIKIFDALPRAVEYGGSSTIMWNILNAKSCSLNGKKVNNLDSLVVNLITTTTYQIVVMGLDNKEISESITISVAKPGVPVIEIIAPTESIPYGTSTNFSWKVKGIVTSVSLNGKVVSDSSFTTPILSKSTEYVIVATGPGGSVTKKVMISVSKPEIPTIEIIAPTEIPYGTATTFSWKIKGIVTSITLNNNVVNDSSFTTPILFKNTEYTLIATGPGGITTKKIQISVASYLPNRTDTLISRFWYLKALDVWGNNNSWETAFVLLPEMKTNYSKFDEKFWIGYHADGTLCSFSEWKWLGLDKLVNGSQTYTYVLTDTQLVLYQMHDGRMYRDTYWRP